MSWQTEPPPSAIQTTNPNEIGSCCVPVSPVLILILTLTVTATGSGMLCASILAHNWEKLQWDYHRLTEVSRANHIPVSPNGPVIRLELPKLDDGGPSYLEMNNSIFLVPMVGSVWKLCIDLPENEVLQLGPFQHSKVATCISYLVVNREDPPRYSGSQLRMQNLAISCALLCLTLIVTAALLGLFGICRRQNSAILMTGVMYLLAALFALLTSVIMILKREPQGGTGTDYDGTLADELKNVLPIIFQARVLRISWSTHGLDLGGVVFCTVASLLWMFLARILRSSTLKCVW